MSRCNDGQRLPEPSAASGRTLTLRELVVCGQDHGLHVSNAIALLAVSSGELAYVERSPLRFTVDAANAWLTERARRQGNR